MKAKSQMLAGVDQGESAKRGEALAVEDGVVNRMAVR